MSLACECAKNLINSGAPSTQRSVGQPELLFFVHYKDSNGAVNKISKADIDAGIDQAYIDAKISDPDPLARWYPIGPFTGMSDVRAEVSFEEFDDGSRAAVLQGLRTVTGKLLSYAPLYKAVIEYWRCQRNFGVVGVDRCGNPVTKRIDASGDLYPVSVNEKSLNATPVKGSNTETDAIMVQFDYSMLENDSDLRVLEVGDEVSATLLSAEGLIQMTAALNGAATTTGFAVDLSVVFDQEWDPAPVTGLVLADFTLYNTTTSSSIVITSVTEAPDGTYTFVIPIQTSADVLRLTSITGGKSLEPFLITIP